MQLQADNPDLRFWTGGCHTFYAMVPELPLAQIVYGTRLKWMRRMLFGTDREAAL